MAASFKSRFIKIVSLVFVLACLELTSLLNDHNKDLTCAFSFRRRISQTWQNVLKFHRCQWSTQHNRRVDVTRWTKCGPEFGYNAEYGH
jgi:hypothetical protein